MGCERAARRMTDHGRGGAVRQAGREFDKATHHAWQRVPWSREVLKMRQALEFPKTRLDLFVVAYTQAVKAERFHATGRHDTSEEKRLAERRLRTLAGTRQAAHEPPRTRA